MTNYRELLERARGNKPVRLVGAAAQDVDTICAMYEAEKAGIIIPTLVGDTNEMNRVIAEQKISFQHAVFIHADTREESAALSVELIRNGKGDFLMKGWLDTNSFLKAIVN